MSGQRIMERTMAALAELGEYPPLPTALFPCDSTATEMAVRHLADRLCLCAQLLDEAEPDAAEMVQRVFLARGLVIARPDAIFDVAAQDALLKALRRYSSSSSEFVRYGADFSSGCYEIKCPPLIA